jgi:hypothetical protein
MIHPNTELRFVSEEIGYGVFATKDIPMGTIVWVQDQLDRVITENDLKHFTKMNLDNLLKYTFRNRHGDFVFCWDHTRFINHSFFPNSMSTSLNFEIAIRDIFSGDEITNDYGTLNIIEPFKCKRNSSSRDEVRPNDLQYFFQEWDKQIESASKLISKVEQPLKNMLTHDQTRQLNLVSRGEIKFPSILENFFRPR